MSRAPRPPRESRARRTALLGLLLTVALALLLRRPVGDEEIAHYLIARGAPGRPDLFLSLVGRPLVTLLYCLPAQLGLTAARLVAALAGAVTIYAVARLLERSEARLAAYWALPLVCLQPFFTAHAGVAMAEPVAAALLGLGLLAWQERRPGQLVLWAALAALTRTELAILWPLVTWQVATWGAGRQALWLLAPFPLWGALGALVSGDPLWLLHQTQWGYYPERDALHYLRSFGWVTGPALLLPVLLGLLALGRRGPRPPDEGAPLGLAAALTLLGLLAAYTALAWLLPVTYGNLRYLAVAAAPLALLAAAGFERLAGLKTRPDRIRAGVALLLVAFVGSHALHNDFVILKRWFPWPAATALLLVGVAALRPGRPAWPATAALGAGLAGLLAFYPTTLYWRPNPELAAVAAAAATRPDDPAATGPGRLRAVHPALAFAFGRNPYDSGSWPPVPQNLRASAAPGTWLFWDSHYLLPRGGSWAAAGFVRDVNWDFRSGVIAVDSTFAGAWFERRAAPRPDTAASEAAERWLAGVKTVLAGAPRTRRLLEADPGDPNAWRSLALQLLATDLIPEARAAFRRTEALAPGAPENALVSASLHLRLGEPETALAALRGALAVRPMDGDLNLVAGRILAALKRPAEARTHLEAAAQRLAKRWDVQYIVGEFLMEQQDWPAAEVRFRAAARMSPRAPDPAIRLVETVVRQRRLAEARALLDDLIRRQPTLPLAYVYLGDLLKAQGRPDEARLAWKTGLDRTGDPTLRARLDGPPAGSGR